MKTYKVRMKKCFQDYKISKSSWDNIGERLHTALRKCCDSDPTSIAYNAIHLMDENDSAWVNYLQWLKTCNSTLHSFAPKRTVVNKIKEWSLKWKPHWFRNPLGNILSCSFNLFTEEDWKAYCSYITCTKMKEDKNDNQLRNKRVG